MVEIGKFGDCIIVKGVIYIRVADWLTELRYTSAMCLRDYPVTCILWYHACTNSRPFAVGCLLLLEYRSPS